MLNPIGNFAEDPNEIHNECVFNEFVFIENIEIVRFHRHSAWFLGDTPIKKANCGSFEHLSYKLGRAVIQVITIN